MVFGGNVQLIGLNPSIIAPSSSGQVSGWGANLITGGAIPNNLQRLNTITISNSECVSRQTGENANRIFDNKLCTFTRPAEGTCYGDEGGALVINGVLAGVLSWQVPCAAGFPDVYERIAGVRLWVTTMIA